MEAIALEARCPRREGVRRRDRFARCHGTGFAAAKAGAVVGPLGLQAEWRVAVGDQQERVRGNAVLPTEHAFDEVEQ